MLLPPAIGTYGNVARNLFRGRGLKLLDMSLTKDQRFAERLDGQLRGVQHPQQDPVHARSKRQCGGAARSIQLGLKLAF
jgi:hypothetical protein